jgi:hypothetical protein
MEMTVVSMMFTLVLNQINWDEIDPTNYFPIAVGNYWEYVCSYDHIPPLPASDTIKCSIDYETNIDGIKWFYISDFPIIKNFIETNNSWEHCGGMLIRYNKNNDLAALIDGEEILALATGDLYEDLIKDNPSWDDEYSSSSSNLQCNNYARVFYFITNPKTSWYAGRYYDDSWDLYKFRYGFGIENHDCVPDFGSGVG